MEIILKGNPEENYFDDTKGIDELKSQVYYDSEKPIRGFASKRRRTCLSLKRAKR